MSIELDEENRKIQKIVSTLEKLRYHPHTQKCVRFYCEGIEHNLSESKKSTVEKYYVIFEEKEHMTYSYFLKSFLSKKLFVYRNMVNQICKKYEYDISLRKKIIIFLGPRCVHCGNEDIDLLQLDHKNNDGAEDRKYFKDHKVNIFLFYWENLTNAYQNLQVLCYKCHKIKSRGQLSIDDNYNDVLQIENMIQQNKREIED